MVAFMQAPAQLGGRGSKKSCVSKPHGIDVFKVGKKRTFSDRHAPKELL